MRFALFPSMVSILCWSIAAQAAPPSVQLEELTWTEVRAALESGTTTIIIPVGGTEQSGPHMALGKHNVRARVLAGRIAATLGDTLVAPVIAYVPEGAISPPAGHMRFPGTISIPDDAFQGLLAGAARSFRQGGFTDVVLIGDHGGYQAQLNAVAQRLNHEWSASKARVHFIDTYYRVTQTDYVQWLHGQGLNDAQIGSHAGSADTALTQAVAPARVRPEQFAAAARDAPGNGVAGDPRAATAALGQAGVDLIVSHSVIAIRKAVAARQ